jgi:hypothetical protein
MAPAAYPDLTTVAPLHRLLLGKALADHGIHRGLNKGRGDPLARAVALARVAALTWLSLGP